MTTNAEAVKGALQGRVSVKTLNKKQRRMYRREKYKIEVCIYCNSNTPDKQLHMIQGRYRHSDCWEERKRQAYESRQAAKVRLDYPDEVYSCGRCRKKVKEFHAWTVEENKVFHKPCWDAELFVREREKKLKRHLPGSYSSNFR